MPISAKTDEYMCDVPFGVIKRKAMKDMDMPAISLAELAVNGNIVTFRISAN